MTTNASKHGLRKAAQERSARHAQRTPLPPKPGKVEDARVVIDSLTGLQAAVMAGDAPDARSMAKAAAFAEKARTAGWEALVAPQGGSAEVTATRGAETIVQAWSGGVWEWATSFYAYGDRNTKPRNASGAAKLLTRSEDDAATEAGKVAANKHFRKSEPKDITEKLEEAQKRLPFDPALATDEEVKGILAGQALVWYNRLSRGQESAIVGRKGVRLTIAPDGERIATFCCPATGYRSCRLSAILRVGRGKRIDTKGSEHAAVEVA